MEEKKKRKAILDQPCEICGDIGFPEVIITCSKCRESHQHIYCMRPFLNHIPNCWLCETCQLNNLDCREACHSDNHETGRQEELQDSSKEKKTIGSSSATPQCLLSRDFLYKEVEVEKLKFLSLEEIYAKPDSSSLHNAGSSEIGSLCTAWTSDGESACSKPSFTKSQALKNAKVNSLPSKNYICNEKAVVAAVYCNRASNSTITFKFGEENLPNPPAVKASWKGKFSIDGFPSQLGLQAYPPGKVSSKAYLVSKCMPSVLRVTLQDRSDVWPETFKENPPCGSDIALYFLDDDSYRSREYNDLMKLLEEKDLSMQSHFDGIELLVFSSKQLPPESQRMNKQFYLWGVFGYFKEQQSFDKKGKQPDIDSPLLDYKVSEDPVVVTNEVNTDEVDMEIDTVGGREVRIVDSFLRRNAFSACLENSNIPSQNVLGSINSDSVDIPEFSKSSVLMNVSPGALKVDTQSFSKPNKLEDVSESGKSIAVAAKEATGGFEDAEDVVCMVCREGYGSRPSDILGIYSYSKRVDLDIGTSASSRSVCVYATVSNFNIIHFSCHQEASLENPKNESEGSALNNSDALRASIFPLRGPFVQLPQYRNRVSNYWVSQTLLHGPADGNRIRLLTYDIVLMLSRFALGASFNTDIKDGGRESNAHFLPFMIQMVQCIIEQGRSLTHRKAMANGISSYLSSTLTEPNYSGPPGFHPTEETVQYMMVTSLLFESYESWLAHRRAFLQRGIYHAYMQTKHGRPVLPLPSGETCLQSEPVNTSEILDQRKYLFSTIRPMLLFMGLIEQLQTFFKPSNTSNATAETAKKNDKRSLGCWEATMKAKLLNVKEMMYLSRKLLSWLDDMESANNLEEAFFVMGVAADLPADEFSSCEGFVHAAIQSGEEIFT